MLYYLILGSISIFALVLQGYLFYKERSELLSRIMANNYQEYEYYKKMFEGEVKELKDQRDDVKKEIGMDEEIKKEMDLEYKTEKDFLQTTEEDWTEDDVDLKELRERIK